MTLPQPTSKKPRYIANFLTYLPYFAQYIGTVSPRLTFGSVALGGWKSNVTVDVSIQFEVDVCEVLIVPPVHASRGYAPQDTLRQLQRHVEHHKRQR